MATANEQLLDKAIRHALYVEKYGRYVARDIVKLLNEADADLMARIAERLARGLSQFGTDRATEILNAIRSLNENAYQKVENALDDHLGSFSQYEASYQAKALESAASSINYAATTPSPAVLVDLVTNSPVDGFLLKSWVAKMTDNRLSRIEQALRIGLTQGQTLDEMVKRIRGTRANNYSDGILQISRKSAQSLALTAVSTVANRSRLEVFKANDKLIKAVRWHSTLDDRTTPICQSRDGKVWALDAEHPTPPAHVRCRSLLVPVTKSWEEMGIDAADAGPSVRASMDGQLPDNPTYLEWLKRQSAERQDAVLGQERARLFREGKVSGDDLYRPDGSFWTLEELRKREGL